MYRCIHALENLTCIKVVINKIVYMKFMKLLLGDNNTYRNIINLRRFYVNILFFNICSL